MNTLYPIQSKRSITLRASLFITLFAIVSNVAHAQDGSYASALQPRVKQVYAAAPSEVTQPFIKVKMRSDKKVVLNWAPVKGEISHYVLERSSDGHTYYEAGLFFTGEWNEEPEYYYTDKFKNAYNGDLYYRLRVVGLDGSVIYTPVTVLTTDRS